MIDLKDLAQSGIDDAFKTALGHLFETYRVSVLSEPKESPLKRFATGYDSLLTSYQDARAMIDSRPPG